MTDYVLGFDQDYGMPQPARQALAGSPEFMGVFQSKGELPQTMADAAADSSSPLATQLSATYVAKVPSPTGNASVDTALITNAANRAYAAGGGVVLLSSGVYKINGSLPVLPGVVYEGVRAVVVQVNKTTGAWLADGQWTYAGGTVLQGVDQTIDCFAANNVDQATVPAELGDTEIPGAGFLNLVLDNFRNGIVVGASNQIGLTWGILDYLYISNCAQWGVNLTNFAHLNIGKVSTQMCQNGQRYASELDVQVFQPANSILVDLYNLTPNDGRDRRTCRGIVFESRTPADGNDASLGQLLVHRAQCNRYNVTKLTVTAGFTSGSADVTVPDGTQFLPGMLVQVAASVAGFTQNYTYVVSSVVGNTITLADSKRTAAKAATATGTGSLMTYGFAAIEIAGAGANSVIQGSQFLGLDAEGHASTGLYLEGIRTTDIRTTTLPQTVNMLNAVGIVARDCPSVGLWNATTCDTDFDPASSGLTYYGGRGVAWGRPGRGFGFDNKAPGGTFSLGGGSNEQQGGDIQIRANGMLYPNSGMAEHVYQRDSNITLIGTMAGHVISTAGSAITYTLPTITTDTGSVSGSIVGAWFEVTVLGAGSVTVQTQGSQLLNKIAGRTSQVITTGQVFKFIAARDNGGNLFWLARQLTPVA